MRTMEWVRRLIERDYCDALDFRAIRQLERIYLKKIRLITLESGQVVSIPEIFRRCGWWSD
jgi:hypothetical protein